MIDTGIQRLVAWSERLHRNPIFEWTTVSIIILSALDIGAKSYDLPRQVDTVIYVLDHFITVYFLVEITIRIVAARGFRNFFRQGWNIFDFIIVAGSLIPVNESEYALLARLLRLFRVLRLIYVVPQLRVLVGALIKAIPRIVYVGLMMFIIFYVYGAVGNLLFGQINPVLWGDIGIAMLTLFRVATFEDWTDVMYETMEVYPLSWLFYLTFIFFTAFVFLNMMIGVIIDALSEEHRAADEGQKQDEQQVLQLRLQRIEAQLHDIGMQLRRIADGEPAAARRKERDSA